MPRDLSSYPQQPDQPERSTDPRRRPPSSTSLGSVKSADSPKSESFSPNPRASSSGPQRHHPYASSSTSSSSSSSRDRKTPAPYLSNKNHQLTSFSLFDLVLIRLQADVWATTELDGLDSDPDDDVLEALEKPSAPINVKAYDESDSDDD
ncbi:hypothetical protein JCM16303_001952 [Sporobolomyces ruberrimus]